MSLNSYKDALTLATRAVTIAKEYQHEMATLEHVLLALLENQDIQSCLKDVGADSQEILNQMKSFMSSGIIGKKVGQPSKSKDFEGLFIRAVGTAKFSQNKTLSYIDILLFLSQLPHEDSFAVTALLSNGVTSFTLKQFLSHNKPKELQTTQNTNGAETITKSPKEVQEAITYLKKFTIDLNELAKNGRIDPVIGREQEIEQIIQVIARRTKNNVALVGESGVGKTAIAEGIAYNIVQGNVPEIIKKSTVYMLDIGSIVGGTRFRGDFEERMKMVLKALSMLENSILFIDEIHTIMDAGSGNKGSLDVANLLKPALAKGQLRCIGSTTADEYRQYFEKDRALVRRFKKVIINEPSPDTTKQILRGLRGAYEAFHGITYTDEALDAAVNLTHSYVQNALLPDKAIDIIDNAGARQRISSPENRNSVIDVLHIEEEISRIVKIPAQEINENETEKLIRLESDLRSVIFGQDNALSELTDAVYVSRAGLRDLNKPAGAYLFAGPTGVGKTLSAKQLAKTLNIPLIKFDMSEYMEKHSVSKLIGAPPGYVGYSEGGAGNGLLTNAIDTNSSCVLLLDEIEKAHEDIFNILLQVMDDGRLTNSSGKTVYFRNVILIMTTNAGVSATERNVIGFGNSENVEAIDPKAIKRMFSPEFRNRLDAIVTFDRLRREHMLHIVEKFIDELKILAAPRNVYLSFSHEAKEWLADKGYDPVMGARPLARVIQENVKKPLARLMLVGSAKNGGNVIVTVVDKKLTVIDPELFVDYSEIEGSNMLLEIN